jgi:hypothetical protein
LVVRSSRRLTRRSPPPVGEQMARSVANLLLLVLTGAPPRRLRPHPARRRATALTRPSPDYDTPRVNRPRRCVLPRVPSRPARASGPRGHALR